MKKKLVSVLLALTLCGSLAIPAFAEPTGELPAPEESENLHNEEVHEHGEELPASGERENLQREKTVRLWDETLPWEEEKSGESIASNVSQQIAQEAADEVSGTILPPVKDHIHITVIEKEVMDYTRSKTQHQKVVYRYWKCTDVNCGYRDTETLPENPEPHSWRKGSRESCQSVDGSTHKSTYNYSCVCGATKTEPETESHSMDFDGYQGSDYHKGTFHYVGYQYHCTACGYLETRYESTPCPGNNKGEGCVFAIHYRVEPPVEVEGTDPVEDAALPEDVTTPEDVMEPDETVTPEEITTPEETTGPEEQQE